MAAGIGSAETSILIKQLSNGYWEFLSSIDSCKNLSKDAPAYDL